MNNVNSCNISNQFFFLLTFQRNTLVMFCYILFLLDGFINVIPSEIITVDVKRKAIGSPGLVSTLLMLKLPEKGKDRNLFNYRGAQQKAVFYYTEYAVYSSMLWLIINTVLGFKERPPYPRTENIRSTIGPFSEFHYHFG